MDLHLTAAQPTTEEKAAVDTELGAPESGWAGGPRRIEKEGRAAFGGHNARSRRHLLLPVLHAIQARIGWISPGALNYASLRLDVAPAEVHGVASFYGMFSLRPRPTIVAHVCDDIGCLIRGGEVLCAELENKLGPEGSPCAGGRATWLRSPCLGLCERAPAALVSSAGEMPWEAVLAPVEPRALGALVSDVVDGHLPAEPDVVNMLSVPQAGQPQLRLLRRVGKVDPSSLNDYRRLDGYEALRRAFDLGPESIVREVIESRLVGRGGAAFPTGKKWEALQKQRHLGRTHYVICNADESEPGTFKDRVVMEGDPFAILEGMTIAALAGGAQQGYIYIRGEYPLATDRLVHAIEEARAQGLLGDNILGRGLRFDIQRAGAPARTFAAKRRRCSIRLRATAASRETSRLSRPKPAYSASRPSLIT